MRTRYPLVAPYQTHHLPVSDGHTLYVEECGNPDGLPVVFLHGGPGAGCTEADRGFFDASRYRIVLFDQRGAGRSKPHASLEANNTTALLQDIESIRQHLGIEAWVVFGGSWGSTLALVYAIEHPERVLTQILRGIFLCRQEDLDWFYHGGAAAIFPDYWAEFLAPIPGVPTDQIINAYYEGLCGADEVHQMHLAKAWSQWEARCATLHPRPDLIEHFAHAHTAKSLARIEAHYFHHKMFLPENYILEKAHRLQAVPTHIIHGRYDMVCPVNNAFDLKAHLPHAELSIICEAGHASIEPAITDALIKTTDKVAQAKRS